MKETADFPFKKNTAILIENGQKTSLHPECLFDKKKPSHWAGF